MHLPYEVWMRVLESITHEHTLARPAYVNCFVSAIIEHRATEQDLVGLLPEFERRAWRATRPYYAISSSIRKAAKQVFLSGVLLQTCSAPLAEVPKKRKGKRTPRSMKRVGGSEGPFWVPGVLERMEARVSVSENREGGGLEPTYLPLEVFDMLFFKQCLEDVGKRGYMSWRATHSRNMDGILETHVLRVSEDDSLLRTVRRVDLLAAAPYEDLMEEARECAETLKREIERTWKQFGIEDGEVRIMH